jgi:hypothetical protein
MQAHTKEDSLVLALIARVNGAANESVAREMYRDGFNRLRSQLLMYPVAGQRASMIFESAAKTARDLAADCLPLGIAVAMHLYPLCALQCVPVPLLSAARFQRAMLLRTIRSHSLILANAGSERARGADQPVIAIRSADGIQVDGTYEYMSLASVADIVFFKAPLVNDDCMVLCAADLRADSVRIGSWKFSGSMRLSDTTSVTFTNHCVPHGRHLLVPNNEGLRCISDLQGCRECRSGREHWSADYQRCWFHLFVADIYLARLERLHHVWGLTRAAEHIVSLNEVARLREYSLRLLDDFSSHPDIRALTKTTSAMKLRVSLLAQSTIKALRDLESSKAADALRLRADAGELGYIKSQPTSDEKILLSLGVS